MHWEFHEIIYAPWSDKEIEALNEQQKKFQPFTCPQHSVPLVAEFDGWRCPVHIAWIERCLYRQTWAYQV